ncbi:Fungalysin metallopeptidase-domain-containing protein [Neocallimastix sp. 'constans']|jgi:extracellular elastinolytic metalloproteinase
MKYCNLKTAIIIASCIFSSANAGSFFPKKVVQYYEKPAQSSAVDFAVPLNITQISLDALRKEYPKMEFKIGNVLKNEEANTAYVHVSQAIDGYEIINSAANINIDIPTRTIISSGMALWENVEKFDPTKEGLESLDLDVEDALAKVAEYFNFKYDKEETEFSEKNGIYTIEGVSFTYDKKARGEKKYITISEKYVDSVWELSLEIGEIWYLARISTTTGGLLNVENIASHAVYNAIPWNKIDITNGRMLFVDPYDKTASPLGWHKIDEYTSSTDTSGNNIIVQENHQGSEIDMETKRANGGESLIFDYPLDLDAPKVEDYFDAAATNVFVLTNKLHDIYYHFGFNEQFGNFQVNNFGKGGVGDDPVKVLIQDRSGTNNANFATPVDGYSPKMRLYPFTSKTPERDSALVNQIMIHEYSHGVTQRLTGGPDKTSCLSSDEANALSEGWSDFFAIAMELNSESKREDPFTMFEWLYGTFARSKPICTDMSVNDLTYQSLTYPIDGQLECHMGGEVWVNALNEVLWNIIDLHGIADDVSEDVSNGKITLQSKGNVLAIQIVIDAVKIQPCNPTFLEARDSIILAQKQRFNNEDLHCAIWKGFAKRGMGVNAEPATENGSSYVFTDNYDLPPECM